MGRSGLSGDDGNNSYMPPSTRPPSTRAEFVPRNPYLGTRSRISLTKSGTKRSPPKRTWGGSALYYAVTGGSGRTVNLGSRGKITNHRAATPYVPRALSPVPESDVSNVRRALSPSAVQLPNIQQTIHDYASQANPRRDTRGGRGGPVRWTRSEREPLYDASRTNRTRREPSAPSANLAARELDALAAADASNVRRAAAAVRAPSIDILQTQYGPALSAVQRMHNIATRKLPDRRGSPVRDSTRRDRSRSPRSPSRLPKRASPAAPAPAPRSTYFQKATPASKVINSGGEARPEYIDQYTEGIRLDFLHDLYKYYRVNGNSMEPREVRLRDGKIARPTLHRHPYFATMAELFKTIPPSAKIARPTR